MLAVGEGGTVLRSTDAGSTWCFIDSETSVDLLAADMVLNGKFTVAGAGGYLAVTTTEGGGCFDPTGAPLAARARGLRVAGPWPQPLAGAGRLELSVDHDQRVRADLVDVAGRRVRNLLDERVAGGESRTVALDVEALSCGVYFVRVEGQAGAETRRLVVVR
jgi:hypothetical protein